MPQETNEEGADALMRRSTTKAVVLLSILIGSLLATVASPVIASAQTAPAADEAPATTSTTTAPSTTVPPVPTTVVPPATTVTTDEPAAEAPQAVEPTLPAALTQATAERATGRRGPANLSEATYVYTPREIKRAWNNSHHDKITLAKATQLSRYMNAVVANQIQQYLLAVYLNAVAASVPNQANWDRVAACESGGNWHLATGNGFYGGLQFSASTWRATGGTGLPHQHTRIEQIRRANILKDRAGLGQWPHCGSRFYG